METKTETKEGLIQRLLLEHEEKQKEKKEEECRKKREMEELHDQYVKVFDKLKVPHSDVIIIRNLDFKKTLVRAYDCVFAFGYLKTRSVCEPYVKGEHDFAYIENSFRSLEERILSVGHPSYYRCDITEMNDDCYYRKDACLSGNEKVHVFYENSATLCQFCGDLRPNKNKDAFGYIFSNTYLTNLRTQAVFYKRCYKHKNMSRKDYLNSWNKAGEKRNSEELMELEESIYPTPIKHNKEYFKKKKEKTKSAPKESAKKKVNYSSNQYTEVGNVYLMKSNLNGRIKIGRTKDKPVYRERTLQSQEPDVRLIFYRKVLFMNETERCLHRLFDSKRFRGEWFDLSKEDIEEAKLLIERATNAAITLS